MAINTHISKTNDVLLMRIKGLIEEARLSVAGFVNSKMSLTYFMVGKYIVEDEQGGEERAAYAKQTLMFLGKELTVAFGRGFSERNLANMKKFYLIYRYRISENILQTTPAKSLDKASNEGNQILQTLSAKLEKPFLLSWSHYLLLCRIDNEAERNFYEIGSLNNNWSYRELERQFNSSLYERLVLSRNKTKVKELSEKGLVLEEPADAIKNPLVLEFLGLKEDRSYSESQLEAAIINKLENFLLELGKGFLFVGRQTRFTFDEEHFFVDLVFYNRLLRCFVLIDLKIGKLKHQDIGQMQMYVNYYDRFVKAPEENNTIGIILCKDKKDTLVEITLPENNKQIFASRYQTILPSKEELKKLIDNPNI